MKLTEMLRNGQQALEYQVTPGIGIFIVQWWGS